MDGKPTAAHPYPELNLGHSEKIVKARRPLTYKSFAPSVLASEVGPNLTGIENEGVAEYVDLTTHNETVMQSQQGSSSSTINQIVPILIVPVNPTNTNNSSNGNRDPETDHTYFKKKKTYRTTSTQTYNSEFLEESNVNFYTGLPSMAVFLALVNVLGSSLPKTRFKTVNLKEQILMILMRLRLGLLYEDMASRFFIKKNMVSMICSYWIKEIPIKLSLLVSYIPRSLVQKCMSAKTRNRYPRLRCIINCFEIITKRPLKLRTRAQMYSHYKSHQTVKYLIGIALHGLIIFI